MIERAVREAMRRIGTRADALGACPVCGRRVGSDEDRIRAWAGTYAHASCATYRRRNSQPVHDSFTAA